MTISTKTQLIQNLKNTFQATIDWINKQPEDHFNKDLVAGKWTIAGHLYHLIKSTKGVSQGMIMPKEGLATMFGKNNRDERSFEDTYKKYKSTVIKNNSKTTNSYEAEAGRIFERSALIKRFEDELNDFIQAMERWDEDEMSIYVLPHPAMGKCTIREFVYFTIFHTNHHLNSLQENYAQY